MLNMIACRKNDDRYFNGYRARGVLVGIEMLM